MKVAAWAKGKISKPGIYSGVDIESYHGDICVGPSVSSSGLRTIEKSTPLHYFETSYLNPKRTPQEPKDHLDFGQLVHTLVLGEAGFNDKYILRPEQWQDWKSKAARDWRDRVREEGRVVVTQEQRDNLKSIGKRMMDHPLIKAGILNGLVEHSMFAPDPHTGVWIKARPDIIPTADGVVADIKTTTDASHEAVVRKANEYNYPMQAALVGALLKETTGVTMTDYLLIWVESKPPNAISVTPIDMDWVYYAGRQARRAIDKFAKCVEENDWPGYTGERPIYMPKWTKDKLDFESDQSLLPKENVF